MFGQAMKEIGLPEVHFHTLRHAQASLLLRKGLDIQATGTRLGHSTATTTLSFYAHTIQETDRTAARMLDRALGDSPKGRKKSRGGFLRCKNGAKTSIADRREPERLGQRGQETPANSLAERHGNRTHPGRDYRPTPVLKTGPATRPSAAPRDVQ